MATLPPLRVAPIATHEFSALSLARPLNACNDRRRIEARSGFAKIRYSTAEREYAGGNKNGNYHHLSRMQGIRLHGKPPWERLTIVLVKARFSNRPSNEHFWLSPRGRACDKKRKLPPDLARERDSLRGNKKFKSRKHYGCGFARNTRNFQVIKMFCLWRIQTGAECLRHHRRKYYAWPKRGHAVRNTITQHAPTVLATHCISRPQGSLAIGMPGRAGPIRYLRLHASLQCNFDGRQ
jgi:hypothetical protein